MESIILFNRKLHKSSRRYSTEQNSEVPKSDQISMDGLQTGRIVHFNPGSAVCTAGCRAAIITVVWNERGQVNLYVFPDGIDLEVGVVKRIVPYSAPEDKPADNSSWHWPERA